ncbi:MAG: ISAzo13 family transposase [Chloroflexota bacterium]
MEARSSEEQIAILQQKYQAIAPYLNERSRRIGAATEARTLGHGGQKLVHEATGLSRATISKGERELTSPDSERVEMGRIRKAGGGGKSKLMLDKNLKQDLADILEASTRGDPETPLLWRSKSTRKIAQVLNQDGPRVSHSLVATILDDMGYSLQGNRKVKDGAQPPDRDAQCRFIAEKTKAFQQQPVISVDTKKKELIGAFKNGGQEYRAKRTPIPVNVHDFMDKQQGKAAPYGVYDLSKNQGWVSVGISSDTAEFAVNSIRSWWQEMGLASYANAPVQSSIKLSQVSANSQAKLPCCLSGPLAIFSRRKDTLRKMS